MCIYMYVFTHVCIHTHIYIYICGHEQWYTYGRDKYASYLQQRRFHRANPASHQGNSCEHLRRQPSSKSIGTYRRGKVVRILTKIQANSGPSKNIYSYCQGRSILAVFRWDSKGKIGQRRGTIVRIYILTIPVFFTFNGKINIFIFLLLFPIGNFTE